MTKEKTEKLPVWDLEKIYPDTASWEKDFARIRPEADKFTAFRGRLGESAETLKRAIEQSDAFDRLVEKVYVYAHLKSDENTADNTARARLDRVESLLAEISGEHAFFTPEIMAVDEERMKSFLESETLAFYRRSLEDLLRDKPHTLSEKEERVIGLYSEVLGAPEKIFSLLDDADMTFGKVRDAKGDMVELTHGNYRKFLESPDRRVRRSAFKKMFTAYRKLQNTFAATLDGTVKCHAVSAKMRGFSSVLEAALFSDKIPPHVYHNLISAVNGKLKHLHAYMELRRRALKLKKLDMYDISTPLVGASQRTFRCGEAIDLVKKSLAVLGREYSEAAEKAFSERWVDFPERKGKRSGAYSSGMYDTYPYILMNFNGTLDDVFTLAHELGHSMHSYFSHANQPYHYADYSIMLAEVASTTNEMLLADYLFRHTSDRDVKRHLLAHLIDEIRATLYRQTMFAEFELWMHTGAEKGVPLTPELLCEKYGELNARYHGSAVKPDSLIAWEWARIPHFYYCYYVYKYATGISAAIAFSRNILEGREGALEKYLGFLKSGGSRDSLDILRDAGVDLTSPEPVDAALEYFGKLVEQLENEL